MSRKPPRNRNTTPYWKSPRARASSERIAPVRIPKLRFVPLETCDRSEIEEDHRRASSERVYCTCSKVFAGGAILTDPPFIDEDGEWTVRRTCYCDHCNHLLMWFELSDSDGRPQGLVKGELAIVPSRIAVEYFLRKHPWAAGILQV